MNSRIWLTDWTVVPPDHVLVKATMPAINVQPAQDTPLRGNSYLTGGPEVVPTSASPPTAHKPSSAPIWENSELSMGFRSSPAGSKIVLKFGSQVCGVVETGVWTADKQPVTPLATN
jgi:hypothetical protein